MAAHDGRCAARKIRGFASGDWLATTRARIQRRQPSSKFHDPERKIGERKFGAASAFDGLGGEKKEAKIGVGRFVLRQNRFDDLAQNGQRDVRRKIGKRADKRFNQFGLTDTDKVARLFLKEPDADMRKALESGSETALGAAGPSSHAANTAHGAREEADQTVSLAERITLQDDGLGFVEWHRMSARRHALRRSGATFIFSRKRAKGPCTRIDFFTTANQAEQMRKEFQKKNGTPSAKIAACKLELLV